MGNSNHKENYENNYKKDKELIEIIIEISDLMHYYKGYVSLNVQPKEYKIFSNKCLKYFKKSDLELQNNINLNDIKEQIKNYDFNNEINSFSDIVTIICNIKENYEKLKTNEKKTQYIEFIYNLLHTTLYLYTEYYSKKNY
jgi:hypothetical protein